MRLDEEKAPDVVSSKTVIISLVIHACIFGLFVIAAKINFQPEETVIPIDLSVVVNENLDGEENEPPPVNDPPPEPEPEPEPVKPPPPPLPEPVVDDRPALITEKKPEPVKKKPEKTKEQIQKERIARIRKSLNTRPRKEKKPTPKPKDNISRIRESLKPTNAKIRIRLDSESGNGRTDRSTLDPDSIRNLVKSGYRPGRSDNIAASEEQRCLSLIERAFYDRWEPPAWNDTLREMHLSIRLGLGGEITGYRLEKSSGDPSADRTVLKAASLIGRVSGLSAAFIRKYRTGLVLRIKVTPQ